MNDKWKKIICIIASILIFFSAGILTERCRCNRTIPESGDLSGDLDKAKFELEQLQFRYEQQLREVEQLREQAKEVGEGIDESIRIAGQADESLRRIGQSIRDAGATATTGRELVEQLRSLNKELAIAIGELQSQNIRLTEELRRIQTSLDE